MCDMTHSYVRHDSFICVTWLIHVCDMTHSYVWHDSSFEMCVTWLNCWYVWYNLCVDTCDIRMCDMTTHSYVGHDLFICGAWLIYMCDMTHSYVWHDSFICVTWLIHVCLLSFVSLSHKHKHTQTHTLRTMWIPFLYVYMCADIVVSFVLSHNHEHTHSV